MAAQAVYASHTLNIYITKADLDALAKAYLAPSRAFQVIVRPEAKGVTRAK